MATTIQVAEQTLGALRQLKEQLRAQSYDEVLQALIMTHRKRALPVRGLTPGIGHFVRDHDDRD